MNEEPYGPVAAIRPFDTFDNSPMFMILTAQCCGWGGRNNPAATTTELRTEVDWVRVWQR